MIALGNIDNILDSFLLISKSIFVSHFHFKKKDVNNLGSNGQIILLLPRHCHLCPMIMQMDLSNFVSLFCVIIPPAD